MVLQLFVQFQIARQEHIQRGGGFGDEAAALVEDGLFEGVAGQTAVAGGAGSLPSVSAKIARAPLANAAASVSELHHLPAKPPFSAKRGQTTKNVTIFS